MGIDVGEQLKIVRHKVTGAIDSLQYDLLRTKPAYENAVSQHAWEYQHLSLMTLMLHEDTSLLQQQLNLSDSQFDILGSVVEYCRNVKNPDLESRKFVLGDRPIRVISQLLSVGDAQTQLTTYFDMDKKIVLGTEVFIMNGEENDLLLLYPDHLDVPGRLIQPITQEPVKATEEAMRTLIGSASRQNPDNGNLTVLFRGEQLQEHIDIGNRTQKFTFFCVNPHALQNGYAIYATNYKNCQQLHRQ